MRCSVVWCTADSQFDGLVPHDDVAGQDKGLDVDDVSVATLRAHVQPLALERKVAEGDPGRERETGPGVRLLNRIQVSR